MPGRLFLTTPVERIAETLGVTADGLTEEPARHNIRPGEQVLALAPGGLSRMRWGMIPVGRVNARGRPVMETIVNARSETVFDKTAFAGVGRAVVPASGWYEWTGKTRRKTAWRISPKDGDLLFFAAITDVWTAPGGAELSQLAMVTCAPSADVEPVHDRMGVLLRPEDVPIWLAAEEAEVKPLMRPWPDGSLHVEEAADVDWSEP